jgi:MFS family permease
MDLSNDPGVPRLGATANRFVRTVEALKFPDIRVLWASTLANQFGQGMQQVALGWLVLEMTGSVGLVGAIFAVRAAPNLIVGLVAGSLTDRLDRRTVMRVSVWGMMLTSLTLAVLLFTNQLAVWQLMTLTFVLGTLNAFDMTSRQVYVYDVVGSSGAVSGIALINLAQRFGQVFGALLAGGLLEWVGPGFAFLAMGIGYTCGGSALYLLRHAGESVPLDRESMAENLINYLRALKSNRVMLSLIISTAGVEVLGFSHQALLPILALDVLHVGAGGLGVLTAFRFIGATLGVATVAVLGQISRRGLFLLTTVVLFGLGQVLLGQSVHFWMALTFVTFINVMAGITDVLHQGLLQLSVSNEQRGRALGSWVAGIGTAPAGHLEVGYLAELTSSRVALLVNGIGLVALAVIMGVLLPRLRRL